MTCSRAKKADCLSRAHCKWENSRCKANKTGNESTVAVIQEITEEQTTTVVDTSKNTDKRKIVDVYNGKPRCSKARKANCLTYGECKWDKRCIVMKKSGAGTGIGTGAGEVEVKKNEKQTTVISKTVISQEKPKRGRTKKTKVVRKCLEEFHALDCHTRYPECKWVNNKCRDTVKMPLPVRGPKVFSPGSSKLRTVGVHQELSKLCPMGSQFRKEKDALQFFILARLQSYHNDWISGADPLALFKANFAVDYFGSQLLTACNPSMSGASVSKTDGRPQGTYKDAAFPWAGATGDQSKIVYTFDIYKDLNVDYMSALRTALTCLQELYTSMINKCSYHKALWGVLLPEDMRNIATKVLNDKTIYNANVHGVYRMTNLYPFNYPVESLNADIHVVTGKYPVNCITRSLISLTLLLLGGVDVKTLRVIGQKNSKHTSRQQTHWAATCTIDDGLTFDMDVINTMNTRRSIPFDTTVAFSKYTRDIVHYYIYICTHHMRTDTSKEYTLKSFMLKQLMTEITDMMTQEGKVTLMNLVTPADPKKLASTSKLGDVVKRKTVQINADKQKESKKTTSETVMQFIKRTIGLK